MYVHAFLPMESTVPMSPLPSPWWVVCGNLWSRNVDSSDHLKRRSINCGTHALNRPQVVTTQGLWGLASTAHLLWTQSLTWMNINAPIYVRLSKSYNSPLLRKWSQQHVWQTPTPSPKMLQYTVHGLIVTIIVSILDLPQLMKLLKQFRYCSYTLMVTMTS